MTPDRLLIPHASHGNSTFFFFGKHVPCLDASLCCRTLIHRDYPSATEAVVSRFELTARESRKISVSACSCDVHPYRLMTINDLGDERYAVEIDRTVRGNRQSYPDVYTIRPALIFLPPGRDFRRVPDETDLNLVIMDRELLLDRTRILEMILMGMRDCFDNHPL